MYWTRERKRNCNIVAIKQSTLYVYNLWIYSKTKVVLFPWKCSLSVSAVQIHYKLVLFWRVWGRGQGMRGWMTISNPEWIWSRFDCVCYYGGLIFFRWYLLKTYELLQLSSRYLKIKNFEHSQFSCPSHRIGTSQWLKSV